MNLSSYLSILIISVGLFGLCPTLYAKDIDYIAYRTEGIVVDGKLDENGWTAAPKSPSFVDLEHGQQGWFNSKAAIIWDDVNLYVGFWIEEPNVSAFLLKRDDKIYLDNDVELFIDGGNVYYELELNAFGTVYEVFWIWDDVIAMPDYQLPEFEIGSQRILKLDGIGEHKHPRGMRTGFLDWDMPNLRWDVNVNGTINDDSDLDGGWTVEIAIPWESMTLLAGGRGLPPKEGDIWRIDCSRFQQRGKDGEKLIRPAGWAWKTHGAFDSHMPEKFPRILFSTSKAIEGRP